MALLVPYNCYKRNKPRNYLLANLVILLNCQQSGQIIGTNSVNDDVEGRITGESPKSASWNCIVYGCEGSVFHMVHGDCLLR